jgi:hypothetical protein
MKIKPVHIQMAPPDGDFPGIVEEGWFTVADSDVVTLCTREGVSAVDASGRKRSALMKAGETEKQVAGRLLRQSLPIGGRPKGYDRPIRYPKASFAGRRSDRMYVERRLL